MKHLFLLITYISLLISQSVKIATTDNYPPITLLDNNRELSGFSKDISDEIFKRLNIDVERVVRSRYDLVLKDLIENRVDIVHAGAYDKERDKIFDFTDPILTLHEVVFINSKNRDIKNFEDSQKYKIGCVNKHTSHNFLKELNIDCDISYTPIEALFKLSQNQIDALIYPREIILYLAKEARLLDKIKEVGNPTRVLNYSIVLKNEDPLINKIDLTIKKMKLDGSYQIIYNRWFLNHYILGYSVIDISTIAIFISLAIFISISLIYLFFRNKKLIFYKSELQMHLTRQRVDFKKQSQSLKLEREKLRDMFDKHSAIMLLINPKTEEILDANSSACNYYGYTKDEILAKSISDINTLSKEEILEEINLAKELKRNYFNFKHQLKNGKVREVEVHSTPIKIDENIALFSIIHDITDKKRAERDAKNYQNKLEELNKNLYKKVQIELKKAFKNERRYKLLFDNEGDGVLVLKDDIFIDCNEASLKIIGFDKKEELIGKSPCEISPEFQNGENSLKKCQELLNMARVDNKQLSFNWIHTNKMGENIYVDVDLTPINIEDEKLIYVIWRDVTEKKKLENMILEAQIISKLGFFEWNIETNRVKWSKGTYKIFGYEDNTKEIDFDIFKSHIVESFPVETILEKFKNSEYRNEYKIKTLNGDEKNIQSIGKISYDNQKNPIKLIGVVQDITQYIKLQKEAKSKEAMLIQQSKMAQMGEMIGAISHQWKQPLNAIALLTQSIEEIEGIDESALDEIYNTTDSILSQVNFMADTITDFRDFFKPSKTKKRFNLKKSISDVYKLLSPQLKKHSTNLNISIDEELFVNGFENEFKQVILNIINNSKDAFIERDLKDRDITIESKLIDNLIYLSIEDNAGGIDKNLLPTKIFDPYVSTKGDNGTGIGLQIAKTIIEDNMSGEISAKNTETGANFSITIPLPPLESR